MILAVLFLSSTCAKNDSREVNEVDSRLEKIHFGGLVKDRIVAIPGIPVPVPNSTILCLICLLSSKSVTKTEFSKNALQTGGI